jgi:transposase
MGDTVDTGRKVEHIELRAQKLKILIGFECLWLYGEDHLPERQRDRFCALKALNLKTARSWAIKDSLRVL